MSIFKKIISSLVLALIGVLAVAQDDLTLYSMNNVQQSLYVNPAYKLKHKVNIGLPGISSVHFDMMNTLFTPKMAFDVNDKGQPVVNVDRLKRKWKDHNYLGAAAKVDLLSFGFTIKDKHYISFSVRENFFSRLTVPEDLLEFPFVGNANEENNGEFSLSGLGLDLNYYRSWGVGFQTDLTDKLRVGANLRFNQGFVNVRTKRSDVLWKTNTSSNSLFDYNFTGQLDVQSSGYDSTITEFDQSLVTKSKNIGLGLDLGAVYQLTDKIDVSAGIIDLGFIRWRERVNNFKTTELDVAFDGVNFSNEIFNPDTTTAFEPWKEYEAYKDSFEVSNDKYTTSLYTKFNVGGNYQVFKNDKFAGRAGLLLQGSFYHKKFISTATAYYTQDVFSFLQASLNYSLANRASNVGFGLSLNLFPIQFYVAVDNILIANHTRFVNDAGEVTAAFVPYNPKKVHVHTGINLTFGRREKDTDKDGIKNRKDDCPKIAGLEKFNGCPDTDDDGIKDSEDDCPEIAGLGAFGGCPDTDKDGIKDSEDDCPEVAGLKDLKGCPDTDSDGVKDSEDRCPEVAGLAEFNGCPDRDGDGVEDAKDDCPENAGKIENNGCPDTDKDGLFDNVDNCPEIAGPKENNGCPFVDSDKDGVLDKDDKCPTLAGAKENDGCPHQDTDGDGVLDKDDKCPATAGVVANNGCPEIEEEVQEIINTAFDNLQFETGRDKIKNVSFESLDGLAKLLNEKVAWKLQISGHTDAVGSASSNLALSKKRSLAVKKYLVSKGVNGDRISALYFGETQPIADNKTKEGREKNRRVEMEIIFD